MTNTSTKPKRTRKPKAETPRVELEPIGPRAANRVREETWPIDQLRPYDRNAKKHDQAQLDQIRASLRQYGQVHRVLVDEAGVVIAGHGRLEALKQEQFAEVRVLIAVGWEEAEKRKFRLADNQLTMSTGWDEKLLKGEVLELGALGVELDQLGFEPGRIAGLLHEPTAGLTDPDEVPEPPPVPTSRRGDVWILGRHRITNGDSTNPEDVARVLAGRVPHLMVTDPPYGVKYDPAWRQAAGVTSKDAATGKVLNDDRADWREAWELFPGDVAYIWHAGAYCGDVANSLTACRFKIRAHIVWVKQRHVLGRGDYHFQHEPCFYAVKDGADEHWHFVPEHEVATYTVRDGERGHYEGGRKQSTVWNIEHVKSETGHGTQKPVEAMKRPIENNSQPGEMVYEPFSGSGTTLIAAEITGRKCFAIELNPLYVDVAVKRWQQFTGLVATLESDGAGEIVAGPLVRLACERHQRDLTSGEERGLVFDVHAAQRAIGFFRDVLTVEVEERDEYGEVSTYASPFNLQPWQAFIIGSLFGWKNALGFRRFRRAYVEIGKGNGKSPLAAGIGHYMLLGCRKLRAEVYSAATDKDQAAILFRDAVAMWERSPALRRRLKPKGANPVWELHTSRPGVNSYFKPISSDKKGKSGIRPYCALIDEVHEHPDNSVIEMMRAGTKGNQEALLFEITNSGFDKKTVCGQEHDMSVRILKREFENDAWFAFIANLDEVDDPFEDETCWPKANPNLGVSIQPGFIREQVQEARGMPSKEGLVRRLHFCQWTESATSAIPRKIWEACEGEVDVNALTEKNVPCYGGLDLSRARDLTAFTLTWLLDATKDQWRFASKTWFWTPADTLKERAKTDRAPYVLWAEQGHMEAVPGPRIKYSWVADALQQLVAKYHPVMIGADQYGLEQLLDALGEKGGSIPAEVHPQGFQRRIIGERDGDHNRETGADDIVWWMPDSINKLEAALLEKRITVAVNPVMRMCAGGVVYEQNRTGHRMFNKDKATTRIDGMVSLAMSIGVATSTQASSSFWEVA